jgi:hypothetical protein
MPVQQIFNTPVSGRRNVCRVLHRKGLDEDLAGLAGVQAAYIMRNDWYWNRFLRQAIERRLDPVAEEVITRSGCSVQLMIEIYGFNSIPALAWPLEQMSSCSSRRGHPLQAMRSRCRG